MRKRQQKKIWVDEPLCQLVKNVMPSSRKSRRDLRRSSSHVFGRRSCRCRGLARNRTLHVRENKPKRFDLLFTDVNNPNLNINPPRNFSVVASPDDDLDVLEFVNPNGYMNPNSRSSIKKTPLPNPSAGDEKDSVMRGKNLELQRQSLVYQQQQDLDEKTRLLKQNSLLKTSVIDSQERVATKRTENEILQACVMEKDEQLQQKDDLILGLEMQIMNYETIRGCFTPNGDPDSDMAANEINEKLKEELNRLKLTWADNKLQYEKRINKLINALAAEKERVKCLQNKASGSEGQLESGHTNLLQENPGYPLKNFADDMGSYVGSLASSASPPRRIIDLCSESGNSATELELLREQNRELDFQLKQSDKTIGELEYLKAQLTMQLDHETGNERISISNTQIQMAPPGQREGKYFNARVPQPRKSKLFNLLSCRKVDIDRNVNGCEERNRVITQIAPELGQL